MPHLHDGRHLLEAPGDPIVQLRCELVLQIVENLCLAFEILSRTGDEPIDKRHRDGQLQRPSRANAHHLDILSRLGEPPLEIGGVQVVLGTQYESFGF